MTTRTGVGPDLVIAGSARSGTSTLAAQLGGHPRIDAGSVKEPNFFSKHFDRGLEWYDRYYLPRSQRPVRLDASVSYTYPQYRQALPRLAGLSPSATVVYVVRDPVARAVSHYLLNRHYFGHESSRTFGAALRERSFYLDVSDYGAWINALLDVYPDNQVLVVPFNAVKFSGYQVADLVCGRLGIDPPPRDDRRVRAHQNNVVTFRSELARRVTRRLRHSAAYPTVRRAVSPYVLKRVRSTLTRVPELPSVEEALSSCSSQQLGMIEEVRADAVTAVRDRLRAQDSKLGLSWAEEWPSGS